MITYDTCDMYITVSNYINISNHTLKLTLAHELTAGFDEGRQRCRALQARRVLWGSPGSPAQES